MLVICHATNAQQCTSGRNVELSVDDQLFTITLYKPVDSSFTVRCRRCIDNGRPSWFYPNGTEISTSCGSGVPVCTENSDERQVRDLMFSSFVKSLEGRYHCTRNSDGIIFIRLFG